MPYNNHEDYVNHYKQYNEEHREEYNWSERVRYALKRDEILTKKKEYHKRTYKFSKKRKREYYLKNKDLIRIRDKIGKLRRKFEKIKNLLFIEVC